MLPVFLPASVLIQLTAEASNCCTASMPHHAYMHEVKAACKEALPE